HLLVPDGRARSRRDLRAVHKPYVGDSSAGGGVARTLSPPALDSARAHGRRGRGAESATRRLILNREVKSRGARVRARPSRIRIMQQVYINQLSKHAGEEVTLRGWLYNMRSSGKLMFPQLRDGTGVVQCVVLKKTVAPEVWDSLTHLGQESPVVVRGTVRADERAPGGYEIDVVDAEVLQRVEGYPI